MAKSGNQFEKLVKIVVKLRKQCPWDHEQTFETLKPYLVEEVYEAMQAIDDKNYKKLADELGDMLLHIVMLSVFARESKKFKIDDVIGLISAKMVRRHPHVFGKGAAKTKEAVWKKWEKVKSRERKREKEERGMLQSIPPSLPALYRADKVQRRAARVGFDWDQVAGAWSKVHEELDEVKELLENPKFGILNPKQIQNSKFKLKKNKLKEEIGDLLFSIVNVARKLDISAEEALQQANTKFIRRFGAIEEALNRRTLTIDEMDTLWNQAKAAEL